MALNTDLQPLLTTVANIAASMQKTVFYWLLLGLVSVALLAWQWLDFTSNIVWLTVQALVLIVPLLVWFFFYTVISQLTELPELVQQTKADGLALLAGVKQAKQSKQPKAQPTGMFGRLWQLIKLLRHGDNVFVIIEAVKGVALLVNPLFAVLIALSGGVLLLFALFALLTLVF